MRFNESDMMEIATSRKPDLEGRLQHRSPHSSKFREPVFRERFFKVIGNLLFYYRISELSQIEDQPRGVIVLENCSVRPDSSLIFPFAFELTFNDEAEKRHVFTTRTEHDMETWINTLGKSSYQYWKEEFEALSSRLRVMSQQKLLLPPEVPFTNQSRVNPFLEQCLVPPPPLPPRRIQIPIPSTSQRPPPPPSKEDDLISF